MNIDMGNIWTLSYSFYTHCTLFAAYAFNSFFDKTFGYTYFCGGTEK